MSHTQPLRLAPADLDRVLSLLVRAAAAAPERVYQHPSDLLADLEVLARQTASARLSLALEQGARDQVRGLARQAEECRRRPMCDSCRLASDVVVAAHRVFGEPKPAREGD